MAKMASRKELSGLCLSSLKCLTTVTTSVGKSSRRHGNPIAVEAHLGAPRLPATSAHDGFDDDMAPQPQLIPTKSCADIRWLSTEAGGRPALIYR